MSENNDKLAEVNSRHETSSILQASRLDNPVRTSVLRPSVLGSSLSSANANNSHSAEVNSDGQEGENVTNPFLREPRDDEIEGAAALLAYSRSEDYKLVNVESDAKDEDPINLLRKNGLERATLFAAAKSSMPRVEKSGFVFGQNVHERVTGENINVECASSQSNNSTGSSDSELLFSSVIQSASKSENDKPKESTETKSLTEVAREYEESRAQKRKFQEVETFTGEEDEINIVDISCKLFAFVNSNWEERGRGSLRLNDSKNRQDCSRVVFRTAGNLRLLVNTKVWPGMVVERPSQKSMRLTAMDNTGQIKVFLVMARPIDITNVHKNLVSRLEKIKSAKPLITIDCEDEDDDENTNKEKCEVTAAAPAPTPSESGQTDADVGSEPRPKKAAADGDSIHE